MNKIDVPYDEIDPEIVPVIRAFNELSFLSTRYCCAGYGASLGGWAEHEGYTNHDYCGTAYISALYDDTDESVQFWEGLLSLDVFDPDKIWATTDGSMAFYIPYYVDPKRCLNYVRLDGCGICECKQKKAIFCHQDELPEKWERVMEFVKGFGR